MPKAFDMSKYQRIVGVSDGRISGKFAVLLPVGEGKGAWVTPIDVTIYDTDRRFGIVFYSDDFTANVGEFVSIGRVTASKRHDLDEVREELEATLLAVVEAAKSEDRSVVEILVP